AEQPQYGVLRKPAVVPVAERDVEPFEHDPQRDRRDRERGELARRGSDPRAAARAIDDRVGEQDESRPADRRVPRRERLEAKRRGGLRDDHDREAEQHHVTRPPNEQPRSASRPTPLPSTSTLNVLPRPPGMMSVLN